MDSIVSFQCGVCGRLTNRALAVLLGVGCYRRVHLPVRVFLPVPQPRRSKRIQRGGGTALAREPEHVGLLLSPERPLLPHPEVTDK